MTPYLLQFYLFLEGSSLLKFATKATCPKFVVVKRITYKFVSQDFAL